MLSYEQFKEKFVEKFIYYLPNELREAKVSIDDKKGTKERFSVKILYNGDVIFFGIPVMGVYNDYLASSVFHDVLCDVAEHLMIKVESTVECMKEQRKIVNAFINNPEELKERIIYCLVNRERNEELLSKVPHRDFFDLAIVYRIFVNDDDNKSFSSAKITYDIAKYLQMEEEELYTLAVENTPKLLPASVYTMQSALYKFATGEEMDEDIDFNKDIMWLATNNVRIHGASVLKYEETMASLADKLNSNLYIFPISIHELIIMKADPDESIEELRSIVFSINEDDFPPEQILGENVYLYDRETHTISIA